MKKGFREIVEADRQVMLPLNFRFARQIAPAYGLVSILLIVGVSILMDGDEERCFVPALVLMGVFMAMSIALLACMPYVRKKALEAELQRYDFAAAGIETPDVWEGAADGRLLRLDKEGARLDGTAYTYDQLSCRIVTNNYAKRINVALWIVPSDEEDGAHLPLTAQTLRLLECLPIRLENPELLAYILSHKAEAFRQIYDRGWVKLPE